MPTIRYHLGEARELAVEIDCNARWVDTAVRAHGQHVGVVATREELQAGRRFDLPGGETLLVRQPKGGLLPEVTLGGRPLYRPHHSPPARLGRASVAALLVSGAQLFLGLRPLLGGAAWDQLPPESWVAAILGVAFLALGGLMRLRSLAAAVTALALLALSTAVGVVLAALRAPEQGVSWVFVVGLVIQVGLLMTLYQGVRAIKDMRREP
jgi:hypothetical protein